jgi:hypothetical protein
MSGDHNHPHGHDHAHPHGHDHAHPNDSVAHAVGSVPADYADLTVPDGALEPKGLSRRRMLQGLGLLGAAGATASLPALPAAASTVSDEARSGQGPAVTDDGRKYRWLAGDHHIHTTYSRDALYLVDDQVSMATKYGLDWMVITDHGNVAHEKLAIDQITPKIAEARTKYPTLVFQGLEWNVPGAEHATVIVPPTSETVSFLHDFERFWDGDILAKNQNPTGPAVFTDSVENTPAAELQAIIGLNWIKSQLLAGRVPATLVLANHPMRKGQVSPHEVRQWRETAPDVIVGWEGAPGHQATGIPLPGGPGGARGEYGNSPNPNSFPGYSPNFYRTWGGFDYATAQVGGLWDSLLAEGRPWWITANSDAHQVFADTHALPAGAGSTDYYLANGNRGMRVDTGKPITTYTDFWPGFYSRTVVGAAGSDYLEVMEALQKGRSYVVHGNLVDAVDLRVRTTNGPGVTVGARTSVRAGESITIDITIDLTRKPNFNGELPKLARVDLIAGRITGPVAGDSRDALSTSETAVVQSFEVSTKARKSVTFRHVLRNVDGPMFIRARGTDARRNDSAGNPLMDVVGQADPWQDLWFYTNPVFVDLRP